MTAESQAMPAPHADFEALDAACATWRERLSRELRRKAARAGARHKPTMAAWYRARSRALERPYTVRAAECSDPWLATITLMCLACGVVEVRPVRCGLRAWCPDVCGAAYRTQLRDRMERGLTESLASEMTRWRRRGAPAGQMPSITMVTLTVRHSGSIAADRHTITRGWQRLRSWLWACDDGRALPYVLAWELTPGRDGLGHVHAHVVAIWPWRDLRALDAEWQRATGGHGLTVDVHSGGARMRRAGPKAAARYVTAYVQAGGASVECPLPMRAEWLRIARTHRSYTAARGLLAPVAPAPCLEDRCEGERTSVGYSRGGPGQSVPNHEGGYDHGGGNGANQGSGRGRPPPCGGGGTGPPGGCAHDHGGALFDAPRIGTHPRAGTYSARRCERGAALGGS